MKIRDYINTGLASKNILIRIITLYVLFFILFYFFMITGYLVLPAGILQGKHPLISNLILSGNLFVCAFQIAAYNFIPLILIFFGNLISKESKTNKNQFIPYGYIGLWGIIVICALYLGTWSFETVRPPESFSERLFHLFDLKHNSGLVEITAYIFIAAASYNFTLLFSNGKRIIKAKKIRELVIDKFDILIIILAVVLLLCSAFIESYNIINIS
ncbi:MAG: hypothetical protein GY756_11135 [bacterium]|nr:hypothetical protein [bacterium]